MDGDRGLASSHRLLSLASKFHDKGYRDGYVASHTRGILAQQMRNFRGDLSQAEYAAKIDKQKTVIGRLENPAYGGWSLRTMLEIAKKENVAVLVRFVDFPTFLSFTDDMSDEALRPDAYNEVEIDQFAAYQTGNISYYDFGLAANVNTQSHRAINVNTTAIAAPHTTVGIYTDVSYADVGFTDIYSSGVTAHDIFAASSAALYQNFGGVAAATVGIANAAGVSPLFGFPSFIPPATPNALKNAHIEIQRLNGVITTQRQTISHLRNALARRETGAFSNPQGQSGNVITLFSKVA